MKTLFALIDRQGKQVMTAYLVWNPPANYHGDGTPGLNIYSETMEPEVWGFWLPFPNDVNVGEVFSLRFEWDKDTTRIFLNETELKDRCPQFSDTVSCSEKVSGGFPTFLSSVNMIQFGADPFIGDNSPMDTTKLLNYQFREIQ